MSVAEISHAIQDIGFLTMIRESTLLYPIIISTHLACIAAFGGMIFVTDLRLLGVAMTDVPVSDLLRGLRIWKRLGLVIILTCGILLATSEMDKYYANPYFHTKLTLLFLAAVHAIVFRRSVYGNAAELDKAKKMPGVAKLAAWTSMIIWVGILSCGRWIAYYEPPDRKPGGVNNSQTMVQPLDRHAVESAHAQAVAATAARRI